MQTVEGKPRLYVIRTIHESFDREPYAPAAVGMTDSRTDADPKAASLPASSFPLLARLLRAAVREGELQACRSHPSLSALRAIAQACTGIEATALEAGLAVRPRR